ncbi:MAG: hypothetical protein ACHQUB_01240 [Candidatus Saccharimonadia bacterium]
MRLKQVPRLFIFLLPLLWLGIQLYPASTEAATQGTATWIDISHLNYDPGDGGSTTFYDNRIDTDYTFYRVSNPGNTCHDSLHLGQAVSDGNGSASTTVGYQKYVLSATSGNSSGINKGCVKSGNVIQLTLAGGGTSGNVNIAFNWFDSQTINTTDCDSQTPDCHTFLTGKPGAAANEYVENTSNCQSSLIADPNNPSTADFVARHQYSNLDITDSDRTTTLQNSWSGYPFDSKISYSGHQSGSCLVSNTIKVQIGKTDLASAPPQSPSGGTTGTNSNSNVACNADPPFSWIVCPLISLLISTVKTVESDIITPLLIFSPLSTSTSSPTYAIWNAFKNLADVGFILIFLFIIFSNMLSISLDAYTVKKILPRLVAAIVLVQLSYFLCSILVDIGNILGSGLQITFKQALLNVPSADLNVTLGTITGGIGLAGVVTVFGAAVLGFGAAIVGALIVALVGAVFAVIGVVITLLFRQVVITLLVILSPLAFIAWILPNTENLFTAWYKNLTKAILMYPLIVLLIVAGQIVAIAASAAPGSKSLQAIFELGGLVAPLFLIPATFKMSGTMIGAASGFIAGRASRTGGAAQNKVSPLIESRRKNMAEEAALNLGNGNLLQRARSRVKSGNALSFGQIGQRRIAATAAAARSARYKDFTSGFEENGYKNSDLKKIAEAYLAGDSTYKIGDGPEMKLRDGQGEAAIAYMGSHGADKEIADLYKDHVYKPNGKDAGFNIDQKTGAYSFDLPGKQGSAKSALDRGLVLGNAKGLMARPVPHMVKDASAFMDQANEGVIAGLKGSSGEVGAHVAFNTTSNSAKRNLDNLLALTKNQDLAKDVDAQTAKSYKDEAITWLQNNSPEDFDVSTSYGDMKFSDYLKRSITDAGGIITDFSARKK